MMNITNWSADQMLQLPDFVFGRRWPISVSSMESGPGPFFDISEAGLGDRCIIWSVNYLHVAAPTTWARISLALGDVLPATSAEFTALEQLFSDLGIWAGDRRDFFIPGGAPGLTIKMRMPIQAQGRRLVLRYVRSASTSDTVTVTIVVSSIPRSIPSWLARTIIYDHKKI